MNQAMNDMIRFRALMAQVGWHWPSVQDCQRFINQEQGELDSALMKAGYQAGTYRRHTTPEDDAEARKQVVIEMGQLIIMILTQCHLLHIDPNYAMGKAMQDFWARFAEGNVPCYSEMTAAFIIDPYVKPYELEDGTEIGGAPEYREGCDPE